MAGSQAFLTLGAIAIFMYMGLNIHRTYISANSRTIDKQEQIDAVNYGITLTEEMYSQAFNYDSLDTYYGNLEDLNNSDERKNFVTNLGDTLAATISLSAEQPLLLGANGRIATITVYIRENGEFKEMSEHTASIIPFN